MNKKDCIIEKLKTGVLGFDHISIGGLPKGRTTLISGTAGSAKTVFATRILAEGIKKYDEKERKKETCLPDDTGWMGAFKK